MKSTYGLILRTLFLSRIFMLTFLLTACSIPTATITQTNQLSNITSTPSVISDKEKITDTSQPGYPFPEVKTNLSQTPYPPPATNTFNTTSSISPQTPTETRLPDPTSTPFVIRLTPQSGLVFAILDQDYVFQVDPTRWDKTVTHKIIPNCRISVEGGHGLETPNLWFWRDYGRFRWWILVYDYSALAHPDIGNARGQIIQGNSFLRLEGYSQPNCRDDQEKLLANLMTWREAAGEIPLAELQSPTPRPTPKGFNCPDTPTPRLHIGDDVSIITDFLYLRSEPRVDETTKLIRFTRFAPVSIKVIGGPICEKFVYWQVSVVLNGGWGESKQGWFAEGDVQEYYLEPEDQ